MYKILVTTVAFTVAVAMCASVAAAAPIVTITAQQIALHADRGLLIAQSGVSIRVGQSTPLTAVRAAYDLRTNRLVAEGDAAGDGYAYDFATGASGPVRNASVPELGTFDALAIGQHVELHPGQTISFANAQVLAGSTFVPAAAYMYAIPPPRGKDFGTSPVPAAAIDYAVRVRSSNDAYAFTRIRYDRYNGGMGAGLEEHYARTNRGYVAFGQTLDVNGGRLDMSAYQRVSDALSQSLTGSYLHGAHAWRYALTETGTRGYAVLSSSQYNAYRVDDLLISGSQRAVGRIASMRLQLDAAHDVHPGDYAGAQDYRLTPLMHVDTAAARIAAASISASADVGEALYDYGRATLASDLSLWANASVNPNLQMNAGATFSHAAPPYPSTYRTYTVGSSWKTGDAFALVDSISYTHDYGQVSRIGRPQWSAAFDVRFRRRNHTGLEFGIVAPFGGVGNLNRQGVLNVRFFKW